MVLKNVVRETDEVGKGQIRMRTVFEQAIDQRSSTGAWRKSDFAGTRSAAPSSPLFCCSFFSPAEMTKSLNLSPNLPKFQTSPWKM